jgi:hypothetical protein
MSSYAVVRISFFPLLLNNWSRKRTMMKRKLMPLHREVVRISFLPLLYSN